MGKTKSQEALQNEICKMEDLLKKKESGITPRLLVTINKQLDQIKKHSYGKKRQLAGTVRNSGLEKVMTISRDLADFSGWDASVPKSRVEITRLICAYIKDHDLQNKDNKKEILLDSALANLLQVEERSITYPHIQKHIGKLFVKEHVAPEPHVSPAVEEVPKKQPSKKKAEKKQ